MDLAVKVKKQLATLAAEKVTREEFWENGSKVGGARVWCLVLYCSRLSEELKEWKGTELSDCKCKSKVIRS